MQVLGIDVTGWSTKKITKLKQKRKRWEYIQDSKRPCLFCGCEKNIEFHHINPTEKESSVTSLSSWSYKKINEELSKCWCLCRECHDKLHRRMCDPLPETYNVVLTDFKPIKQTVIEKYLYDS